MPKRKNVYKLDFIILHSLTPGFNMLYSPSVYYKKLAIFIFIIYIILMPLGFTKGRLSTFNKADTDNPKSIKRVLKKSHIIIKKKEL